MLSFSVELVLAEIIGLLLGIYGLYTLNKHVLSAKILRETSKLKSMMANFKSQYPEIEERRSEIVASGLGDIGIEGIMKEIGIDPKIMNNPLVKGLVDRYAPKLLEQLSKGKNATNNQSTEIPLL